MAVKGELKDSPNKTSLVNILIYDIKVNARAIHRCFDYARKAIDDGRVKFEDVSRLAGGAYYYVAKSGDKIRQLKELMEDGGILDESDRYAEDSNWRILTSALKEILPYPKVTKAYNLITNSEAMAPYLMPCTNKTGVKIGNRGLEQAKLLLISKKYRLKEIKLKVTESAESVENESYEGKKPTLYWEPNVKLPAMRKLGLRERKILIKQLEALPKGTFISPSDLAGKWAIGAEYIRQHNTLDGALGVIRRGGAQGEVIGWPKEKVIRLEEIILQQDA